MIRAFCCAAVAAALLACSGQDDAAGAGNAGAPEPAPTRAMGADGSSPFDEPATPVAVQEPAYGEAADRNLLGYLAMPGEGLPPFPGVIVVHESNGLDDGIKALTRRLAAEGFMALAVDLYAGRTAARAPEARALMTEVMSDPVAVLDNLRQAHAYLEEAAFAPSIAALGIGFGGGWALQMALEMPDELDAAIMYYGQIVDDTELLGRLEVPILGLYGESDAGTPVADVRRFRAMLNELGKEAEIFIYSGVGRSIDDPDDADFDMDAAVDAWRRTVEFLRANTRTE